MNKNIQLTKREEELMNFLWEYGKPATSKEMLKLCQNRTWSESYLHVMLRSLENKGAIEKCGFIQYGKQYARQFKCSISKEAYYVQLALERGVNGNAFAQIAVSMAAQVKPKDKDELIQTLEEIIEELMNQSEE